MINFLRVSRFNNHSFSFSFVVCFSNGGQVVAITVFFLLSVAYYAFFAPFLGKDIYEYVAIGVYSIVVSIITFNMLLLKV